MQASESAEAKAKEENIKVEMIYAGTLFGEEVRVKSSSCFWVF